MSSGQSLPWNFEAFRRYTPYRKMQLEEERRLDVFPKEKRSKIMASIRSKDTMFEKAFLQELRLKTRQKLELHPKNIAGVPDMACRVKMIAIFLDSCFWHGCKTHFRMPKSNIEYWSKKVESNRKRDRLVSASLRNHGWRVIRNWEHSLKKKRVRKWWLTRLANILQ